MAVGSPRVRCPPAALAFVIASWVVAVDGGTSPRVQFPGPVQAPGPQQPPPLQPPPQQPPPLLQLQLVPSLSPLAGRLLDEGQCAADSAVLEAAASNRSLWAVRMLDACGGAPAGLMVGARYSLGNFDACMAAAATSPVGARYCLARLRHEHASPARLPVSVLNTAWDDVEDLPPHQDVADILSGAGMLEHNYPPGDVRVALCVPRSCGAAALQAALRRSLREPHVVVDVRPEHCVEAAPRPASTPAGLFWCLVAALTLLSLVGPVLGWSAFDWRRHLRALGKADPPVAGMELSPLSGIRLLNALYIVILHRGAHSGRIALSNGAYFGVAARSRPLQAYKFRGNLATDSFLFLAGFMLAVIPVRASFGTALVARLVRSLSVYAVVLLFYATAMPDLGTGPMWAEVVQPQSDACRRWWLPNLLLVGNYVHGGTAEPVCMEQSWSLFADVHLFALGMLVLRWLPAGLSGLAVLAGLAALSPLPMFALTWLRDWPATFTWSLRTLAAPWTSVHLQDAYIPTHMKWAPYFVGLLAGRGLLELQARGWRPGMAATLGGMAAGLAAMFAAMCAGAPFAALDADFSALSRALYAALAPLVWSLGLAVVVVAIAIGKKTCAHHLLSWQPMVTLSRLTFGVYLVSYPLQSMVTAANRDAVRITFFTALRDSMSDMVFSFAASLWLAVAVEAPARVLVAKLLLGNRTPSARSPASAKEGDKED